MFLVHFATTIVSILIVVLTLAYLIRRWNNAPIIDKKVKSEAQPLQTRFVRLGVTFAVTGSLLVIVAIVYLLRVGLDGGRTFWRIMDFALLFMLLCAFSGLKYVTIEWKNRVEKRRQLLTVRALIVFLFIISIPVLVLNWFRT